MPAVTKPQFVSSLTCAVLPDSPADMVPAIGVSQ